MKAKSNLKLKKDAKVSEYSATERLLDETFIAQAIWECEKQRSSRGCRNHRDAFRDRQ